MIFISDDRVHDQHAVQHFITIATEHLAHQGIPMIRQVHFSDGAGSQYKNKVSFNDASFGMDDFGFPIEKHFFGSGHGKGPCDAEIGVVKKCASRAVLARQVIIANAHDLYKFGRDYLTLPKGTQEEHTHAKRKFFFVRDGEVKRGDERIARTEGLKPVPQTRAMHSFVGEKPNIVSARERSCFCEMCIAKDHASCANTNFLGTWKTFSLKGRGEVFNKPLEVDDSILPTLVNLMPVTNNCSYGISTCATSAEILTSSSDPISLVSESAGPCPDVTNSLQTEMENGNSGKVMTGSPSTQPQPGTLSSTGYLSTLQSSEKDVNRYLYFYNYHGVNILTL
ncbi:hypothetical protein HOLleu_06478 [Holothuria leucospilota]|uniref:Uncharacterized protein n=1 Tax=Holothuria leucospilota TaxID=206669 RepID=A0A9Q1HF67_HOLLE|nr:hypothetical protein HOLleu_06478 [Holothuria leucospilota]